MIKITSRFSSITTSIFATLITLTVVTLGQAEISEQAKLGRHLFYDPSFGGSVDPRKATGFSCASCHADFDESKNRDGLIRSGHSIIGVPNRKESQWEKVTPGLFQRTAGGAGVCYQQFLQAIPAKKVDPVAIPEDQAKALMAYFDYITQKVSPPQPEFAGPEFTYGPLSREEARTEGDNILKLDGDKNRGWKLYGRSCANCHAGPKKRGIGSQLVRSRTPNIQARLHKIASYVRQGGYLMPAIGKDKLSDQDMADIVAFLEQIIQAK